MDSEVVLDGRYRLLRVLGKGAMGTVWEAVDLKIRRPVAVKTVLDHRDSELVDRMIREATAAGRLSHPHIVTVHDYGQTLHSGALITYIVMELVDGRTLTSMLLAEKPDLSLSLSWARQITLALGAAHGPDAGVVHRDLKPDNILITRDGLVKIVDFGIARSIGGLQPGDARLTKPGTLIGTPTYMAPEQCLSGPLDGRTDLYALGCLLYEMVTGAPPFTEGSPLAVALAQVHDLPDPPRLRNPDVPEDLDLLIRQLLAKDPAARPADAAAVHSRLVAIGTALRSADVPAGPAAPVGRYRGPTPDSADHLPDAGELRGLFGVTGVAEGGHPAEAVRLWRDVATELGRALGPRHFRTLAARRTLAWHVGAAGRHDEAAALWDDVVPDLQFVHGHFHRVTYSAQRLHAWNTGMAGRPADAVRLLAELLPDVTRLLGRAHADVLETRRFQVWFTGELGRHGKAIRLLRKLVPDLGSALGPGHPHTLEARRMHAWNTEKSDDRVAAVQLLRELIQDVAQALGPDHEQCAEARRLLDRCTR